MNCQRFIQDGAVWAWPLHEDPLTEARKRYTVTGNPQVVDSPWGRALRFDGTNDYITLKSGEEYDLRFDSGSQDFSLATWIRYVSNGSSQIIIDKRDAGNDGWFLMIVSDGRPQARIQALQINGPSLITDQLWHSIVLTVDRDGNAYVYFDGTPGSAVGVGSTAMATTILPKIGVVPFDLSAKFAGDMAGIVVWDRALTPEEAVDLSQGRFF